MTLSYSLGPLVLAGSGEYTPAMDLVDRYLLEAMPIDKSILLIATSCAQEGLDVMERWEQMGVMHFRRLGVEARPLRIVDHDDADRSEVAEQIAEAGFVWFSGGSPAYLAQSFHQTSGFHALERANREGAVVAGASGGLGVLNVHMDSLQPGAAPGVTGLGLSAPLRAMAHFDRMEVRRPEFVERTVGALQPGQHAIGVDEDTALVWTGQRWQAMGNKRVVVFESDLSRHIFRHGDVVEVLPPPLRAQSKAALG
jgi:cyanophycinase